jgi:hypothetical protein
MDGSLETLASDTAASDMKHETRAYSLPRSIPANLKLVLALVYAPESRLSKSPENGQLSQMAVSQGSRNELLRAFRYGLK